MPDQIVADASRQWIVTGLVVGLGTLIPQWLEARKKKANANANTTTLGRIEKKIDENHEDTRRSIQLMQIHLNETERIATDALHHAVGPDGKGGHGREIGELKERVSDVELWQESETRRERDRLQRLQDEARLPNHPLTPRTT